jgi:hypothetical protein
MLVVTLAMVAWFAWLQATVRAEPPSVDSGANFAVTFIMTLIVLLLASFTSLTTTIDENYLHIKFGYGAFTKKFALNEITSVKTVKNHWYYGWGIKVWFWPYMWIYNISGFNAVEIVLKNGRVYRIGTDVPAELESALKTRLGSQAA